MKNQTGSLQRNIANLFISQGASFIVPLLQFPYLTRVLGTEEFGLFVFSYGLILFLLVITNFGFELYLPNEMADKRNSGKTNHYYTNSALIRFFLFLVCIVLISLVYIFTDYYKGREEILLTIIASVFFNSFTFLWLFQGKELLYVYSRIVVIIRLFSVALIFLLVKESTDLVKVMSIIAFSNGSILITSYILAKKKFNLQLTEVDFYLTYKLASDSFEYFLSRLGVSVYAALGGVLIGMFSGSLTQVAYYGAAHQLYTAGLQAMSALSSPLLPYMARTKNYRILFKITLFSLILTLCGALIGIAFGEYILDIVYGEELVQAKPILNVFMITIFFSVLGQQMGYPALLPLGKGRQANLSVMYAGVAQIIIILILLLTGIPFTALSIALAYLVCDLVMSSYRCLVFSKTYFGKSEC